MDQLDGVDSEIVNRLNTAYRKVLVVGKTIYVPPIYSARRGPYQFHAKQLRFLYHLTQVNDFPKACELTPCTTTYATRFLKSKDYREFAAEAINDQAIQDGWTPRRLVVEIDRIYQGEKTISGDQMDALRMMKDIVVPRARENTGNPGTVTVNLNFPVLSQEALTKLKEIGDREASIDAEQAA